MNETEQRLLACEELMRLLVEIVDLSLPESHFKNPKNMAILKKIDIIGKCYTKRWPKPFFKLFSDQENHDAGMEMAKYYEK